MNYIICILHNLNVVYIIYNLNIIYITHIYHLDIIYIISKQCGCVCVSKIYISKKGDSGHCSLNSPNPYVFIQSGKGFIFISLKTYKSS